MMFIANKTVFPNSFVTDKSRKPHRLYPVKKSPKVLCFYEYRSGSNLVQHVQNCLGVRIKARMPIKKKAEDCSTFSLVTFIS